ncbi:MAG TPA: PIG-L deacetylase family protein [Candidatus Nanoarchaeia archaeon]|nr:PIG-L deacetylase family protein [Candidatus Nanoarchaeia archaeon]
MKKETILVLSAHTDDFVLGAGGMIITAVQDGKKVIPIVFSLGEKSHFWIKDKVIKKVRADETIAATKLLKCKEIILDVKDGQIYQDYKDKHVEERLLEIIEKEKPTKIFTHSNEDPHPDHRAVNKITLELLEKTKEKPEVYIYSIWNPVSLKTSYPALYVDITNVFSLKMKALKMFQSQKVILSYPLLLLFIRNIIDGIRIRKRFAEKFYKIR